MEVAQAGEELVEPQLEAARFDPRVLTQQAFDPAHDLRLAHAVRELAFGGLDRGRLGQGGAESAEARVVGLLEQRGEPALREFEAGEGIALERAQVLLELAFLARIRESLVKRTAEIVCLPARHEGVGAPGELFEEVASCPSGRRRGQLTTLLGEPVRKECGQLMAECLEGPRAREGVAQTSEELRSVTESVGPELSMGMTNDLEIAIRQGSTMVRIGTALFGERGTTQ